MKDLTVDYCERRAQEEKRAAMAATCNEAALAHRQLAREFAAKAQALRADFEKTERRPVQPIDTLSHQE